MPRPRFSSPQTRAAVGALLQDPTAWQHGYALCQATGLASGTLYPILRRLLDAGLLEARWSGDDEGTGPRRHLYRLTGDGRVLAAELARGPRTTRPLRPARAVP